MDAKQISETFFVAQQLDPTDLPAIAEAGFRAIMCNRPDEEDAGQPSFQEIAAAANELGLDAYHLPVKPGAINDEHVEAFGNARKSLPGPMLAYCRTGTRSAILWSLNEAQSRPLSEILAATRAAGYDMDKLAPKIAERAKTQAKVGDASLEASVSGQ